MDSPVTNGNTGHWWTQRSLVDTGGTGGTRGHSGHRRHLSSAHARTLFEESGINPDVSAERGYETVESRANLLFFKKYQRRPGLYIPIFSPDGETTSAQLRPDRPRTDKKGKALRYETPGGSGVILDAHPRLIDQVRSGAGDLWITEGIKKADALTSRGIPTIGLIGVWNWQRNGEMLPCWNHVRLDGRQVYVVFDSDVMVKPEVQLALERLVVALEGRGADVRVVYLPDGEDGRKVGVDDYLVAGGTIAELKALARRFEPEDLGRIRLSRDEKLRALVEDLERRHGATRWTWPGADADEDVFLKFIERARRYGKAVDDGLRITYAQGPLALDAKISSRTAWKSVNRLEARGFMYRDNEGRKADKAGAFVVSASVSHKGGSIAEGGKATKSLQACGPLDLHPRSPRLWASRPKWKPTKKMIREHRMGVRAWMPEPREGLKRLGKKRGQCIDRLDVAGGTLTVKALGEKMGVRPRDLVRRKTTDKGRDGLLIWLQDVGVLTIDGDTVSLTPDWLERLEEQRELGEEIEAEEVARRRYRIKSRDYHRRGRSLAPESKPSAAGLEAVRKSHATRDARLREIARAEEERRRAGPPSALEVLISGVLDQLDRLRMGLLCEVAMQEGFNWRDVPEVVRAMGHRVERLPEYGDEEFVFPLTEGAA